MATVQLPQWTASLSTLDSVLLGAFVTLTFLLIKRNFSGSKARLPPLRGPPRTLKNFLFGYQPTIHMSVDPGEIFRKWVEEYGTIFRAPMSIGNATTFICDPKAIQHFYARETYTYVNPHLTREFLEIAFGRGVLWAEGDVHKRQRRILNPAFSNAAIRELTSVFYDSAYKLVGVWDSLLQGESSGSIVLNVQNWMNKTALDSIGIAGFGHDFGSLDGKDVAVATAFEQFGGDSPTVTPIMFLLAPILPWILRISGGRDNRLKTLRGSLAVIAESLFNKSSDDVDSGAADKSVIGLLVKSGKADTKSSLTEEEVLAQINTLLLAGYETTSVSLTWTLIELCRHPEVQTKLRQELLSEYPSSDPNWDALTNSLPYLDAVVHEILRIHAPLEETVRVADEDDIIPLSNPITTATGQVLESVFIPKGTLLSIPISCINTLPAFWGPTSTQFIPERWLPDSKDGEINMERAKEIQSYRHLLTFIDGPRTCLGKGFALAEFKAVLSVLIRNFVFEFPNGEEDVNYLRHYGVLPRPKVEGTKGPIVMLRVRRVE